MHTAEVIPELDKQLRKFVLYVADNPREYPMFVQTLMGSKTHPAMMMLLIAAPDDMIEDVLKHFREEIQEAFRQRGLQSLTVQ